MGGKPDDGICNHEKRNWNEINELAINLTSISDLLSIETDSDIMEES